MFLLEIVGGSEKNHLFVGQLFQGCSENSRF